MVKDNLEKHNRRVQIRLDSFERRLTHQLKGGQTPSIAKVKAELDEVRKMIDEINDGPVIPTLIILEIQPEVKIPKYLGSFG